MQKLSPSAQSFGFYSLQFRFSAREAFAFPTILSANIFRGALGLSLKRTSPLAYQQCFAPPASAIGPSGLANPPRPFVFRTRHLDGQVFSPGEVFSVNMNLLHSHSDLIAPLTEAFAELGRIGFGPQRSRAELIGNAGKATWLSLPLDPLQNAQRIRIEFLTPTELKSDDSIEATPQFDVLVRRARDRISNLRRLYGSGPIMMDFEAFDRHASTIELTRDDTHHVEAARRSSRTGQVHPLGGLVGGAEYAGTLSEFLPYLEIAGYTGVGRQTVWGKGEIAASILS